MSDKDDGGPAFPETRYDREAGEDVQWEGMSLRDWFAGQALAGLLARVFEEGFGYEPEEVAYAYADKMLIRRSEAS